MLKLSSLTKITAWTIALAIILIGILIYWRYATLHPSTDDAYVQAHVIHIAPQVSGPISAIYIKDNQIVQKDQKLFDIDPKPFQIAVQAAQAKLDLTQQNIKALEDAIQSAQALVDERQSEYTVTVKNSDRILKLVKMGQESRSAGDEAKSKIKVTLAGLQAAKSQLEEAKQNLGKLGNQNAQIRAAAAALDHAKLDLEHTYITAPAVGKVVNFNARSGSMVQAGVPIFDIVEQNSWWVTTNLKETQLKRVQVGQPAIVVLDMYPDHQFNGIVESISAGSGSAFSLLPPENATGNWVKVTQRIPVKVVITDSSTDFPLRVGASATVTIDTTK